MDRYCLYRGPGEGLIDGKWCPSARISLHDNFCREHNQLPKEQKEQCAQTVREEGRSLMKRNWGK